MHFSRDRIPDAQMERIAVVGTVHGEKGRANTSGLVGILERIKP